MCVKDGMQVNKRTYVKVLSTGINPGLRLLNKIIFKKSTSCDAVYSHVPKTLLLLLP